MKLERHTREEMIADDQKFESATRSMDAYIKALKAMNDEYLGL